MAIYLDSNATTRVHPEVIEAMMPFFTDRWQNPSSAYRSSATVRDAVEHAREQVASLIGAKSSEIVFTGSGSEANNAAIKSLAREVGRTHSKVLVSEIEHSAVLRPVDAMSAVGFEVEKIGVEEDGRLDLGGFSRAVDASCPGFVSLMWANNETGVTQPLAEVCRLAKKAGWFVHSDAVAAIGKVPVRVDEVSVDFLSLSGHKFHAPKGIGALFIREGTPYEPMIRGGGQERGRRSGTENVPYIVGLGAAAAILAAELEKGALNQVGHLRDRLEEGLRRQLGEGPEGVRFNGSREHRTPNVAHLSFGGCRAADLITALDEVGVECASGSACMAGKQNRVSHVQKAMGFDDERALGGLRFSLSLFTSGEEIDEAVRRIVGTVAGLKA